MRILNRCTLLALVAGSLAAQALHAQEAQPRTHTVKRGDTLWDLAQFYLGDPFLWPEIYRLNRDVVEDPHWIYPGEVLRLPGSGPTVAEAPQPQPGEPAPTPAPADTGARVTALETTIFGRVRRTESGVSRTVASAVQPRPTPTVRAGEVIAAPYVDREGGPRGFGRILKSGDLTGVAESSERFRFQAYDRLFIAPPVGYLAAEGERFLAYKLGPLMEAKDGRTIGQVVIPTGIIEVTQAAGGQVAAKAKVVRAFNELTATDRLIPLDTAGISTTVRPLAVADGPSTTVKWIYGEPVLPSVQAFVVLDVSSHQGVHMGDEFLIYRARAKQERGQLDDPEIPIGKAQVVRSTPFGVTAVVLGQEQPAIKEGMPARIIARMP
jgi:LysM repeat protein